MKESKEYKGVYFSNRLNNKKRCTSDKNLKVTKKKHKYFENGAHFKYSSLYNELQKLFKIQNYSLPKKKRKKKKDCFLHSESKQKNKPFFLFERMYQIKNKNKHNAYENKNVNKSIFAQNNYNNKNIKSQTIKNYKNKKNVNCTSMNNENRIYDNKTFNKSCDNKTKNKINNNKSKVFHSISAIKQKGYFPEYNTYKNENCKTGLRKNYSSFVNTSSFSYKLKLKKMKLNIKTNNNMNNKKIKIDVIKVKTKIMTPVNNNFKKLLNSIKMSSVERMKNNNLNLVINNKLSFNKSIKDNT